MTMPKFKLTYIDATTGECHRARLQVDPRFGIDVRALRGDPENRKPPITYKPTTNDLEMMAKVTTTIGNTYAAEKNNASSTTLIELLIS